MLQRSGRREPVVVHRRRRHQHDAEQRPHADQPEAAVARAHASAAEVIRRLQTRARRRRGITLYMQPVQDLTIEDRVSRTQYQFTLEDAERRRALGLGAASWSSGCASCRSSPTSPATCRTAACRPTSTSTARPPAASASRRGHRQRALQRVRPAPGLDDLHPDQPVPRRARSEARVPARPGGAGRDLRAGAGGRRRRDERRQPAIPGVTASATAPHLRRLPRSRCRCRRSHASSSDRRRWSSITSASFRRRRSRSTSRPARRWATRSRRSKRASRSSACPRSVQIRFQGAALAFRASLANDAVADPRRDRHDVHRARRALRELHPSDHDPVDAAVGRRRRAARADARRPGPRHHRDHRHHPADRHRQEERDHDDRLRARRRAQGRQGAARGDLPGVPAALPADPDDDDGGAARRAAADARLGRRAPSCAIRSASRWSAA